MFYFMEDYKEKMFLEIMCKRMGCLPVILMFVLLSVVGCKTIKDSELIEIHDTVNVHHGDTLKEYIYKHIHDTVREYHNEIITLKQNGDTAKHEVNNYYYNRIVERDSTDRYRSSIDSLKAIIQQLENKEKVVKKEPSIWDELSTNVIVIIVMLIFLTKSLQFKK